MFLKKGKEIKSRLVFLNFDSSINQQNNWKNNQLSKWSLVSALRSLFFLRLSDFSQCNLKLVSFLFLLDLNFSPPQILLTLSQRTWRNWPRWSQHQRSILTNAIRLCTVAVKEPSACATWECRHCVTTMPNVSSIRPYWDSTQLRIRIPFPVFSTWCLSILQYTGCCFVHSFWRARGSKQSFLLLRNNVIHLWCELQPQWTLHDDTWLPVHQNLGPQHGDSSSGDLPGTLCWPSQTIHIQCVACSVCRSSRIVVLYQVHEYLRSKLCSLYENDCIFDKFECCWNGNDRLEPTFSRLIFILASLFCFPDVKIHISCSCFVSGKKEHSLPP